MNDLRPYVDSYCDSNLDELTLRRYCIVVDGSSSVITSVGSKIDEVDTS